MLRLLIAFLLAGHAAALLAQVGYPRKPILMIVPLQAASAVDNAALIVAQKMADNMGQPIVIENVPGAAGLIGAERVAKAAPDGYIIGGFNDSIMTMLPNVHVKMPWDILKDFEPVSLVASMEWALIASPAGRYRNAGDLIESAKAKPGTLNYSSGGNGSPQHVATGQVDANFSGLPTVYTLIKSGKLRAIGIASAKRSAVLPDVPTVSEFLPGFEFNSAFSIVVPAGTPRDIVARLNAEVAKAVAAPEVREKLVAQGFSVVGSSPEDLFKATREQLERYGKLFKQVGIKAE